MNMASQLMLIVTTLTIGCLSVTAPPKVNYCDPQLCSLWNGDSYSQRENIACKNNGTLNVKCPNDTILIDINPHMELIIMLHNDGRNKIALGKIEKMEPATKMKTVKWNHELQFMAELNCKRCIYSHDKCRNTPNFPNSGQNIGIVRTTGTKTPQEVINRVFNDWFKEHKHAHMDNIINYTGSNGGPSIGHFSQIIQSNASQVGCGIIKWHETHHKKYQEATYFVCNYGSGNMEDSPIYVPGSTAAKCDTGTNPKYTGLCSEDEEKPKK